MAWSVSSLGCGAALQQTVTIAAHGYTSGGVHKGDLPQSRPKRDLPTEDSRDQNKNDRSGIKEILVDNSSVDNAGTTSGSYIARGSILPDDYNKEETPSK